MNQQFKTQSNFFNSHNKQRSHNYHNRASSFQLNQNQNSQNIHSKQDKNEEAQSAQNNITSDKTKQQYLKRKHSIEAEKLNILNNIEDFELKPYRRLVNDQQLIQYKEEQYHNQQQPTRAQSALDFNKENEKVMRHRRVQSHAFQDRSPIKHYDGIKEGGYGNYSPTKKSSVNTEVKFISQRVNEAISAFDNYKNQHLKRLDTVKQTLKEHTKVIKTNEHVEHEIQLLKKVRQMTQKSYHTRIRTGGSLIDFTMIKHPNPNDFLKVARPDDDLSGSLNGTNIEEVQEKFKQHFKHSPKYPLKIQSIRTSSRVSQRKISISEPLTHNQSINQHHSQNKNDSQHQPSVVPKRALISQKKLIDIKNLKLNSTQDEDDLRRDEIRSLMHSLPVILAKNPQDKESTDYLFFKGTNFLYNHDYHMAIDIFSQAEIQT